MLKRLTGPKIWNGVAMPCQETAYQAEPNGVMALDNLKSFGKRVDVRHSSACEKNLFIQNDFKSKICELCEVSIPNIRFRKKQHTVLIAICEFVQRLHS